MKNVLVILGRYYPKASPNAICIRSILDELPPTEYNVHIVAYNDDTLLEKPQNITRISRGLIHNVKYKNEDRKKKLSLRICDFLLRIKSIMSIPIWPWQDPVFTHREYVTAERLYSKYRFDIVIAVHMPLSSLIVAHRLKEKHPQLKYIAYFLDALSGGYVPKFMRKKQYERKAIKWEKKLTFNADKIVYMKSLKNHHDTNDKLYETDNRISYLDIPLLKTKLGNTYSKEKMIVYVGSIAMNMRSPEFILKVFSLIPNPDFRLIFVGEANCDILNNYAIQDSRITVIGRCSHDKALEYEREATVLLNLGNKNPNLAPSKVFEYMSWKKKIVSTVAIDGDTSVSYLCNYPDALILSENESIELAAEKMRLFVERESKEISDEYLRNVFWDNTPNAFIELLEE